MTIYRYYLEPKQNKIIKTEYDNVEIKFGCYVIPKFYREKTLIGYKKLCDLNDVDNFERCVLYSFDGNKDGEFLELVIEHKKEKMKEALAEYQRQSEFVRELESQR